MEIGNEEVKENVCSSLPSFLNSFFLLSLCFLFRSTNVLINGLFSRTWTFLFLLSFSLFCSFHSLVHTVTHSISLTLGVNQSEGTITRGQFQQQPTLLLFPPSLTLSKREEGKDVSCWRAGNYWRPISDRSLLLLSIFLSRFFVSVILIKPGKQSQMKSCWITHRVAICYSIWWLSKWGMRECKIRELPLFII